MSGTLETPRWIDLPHAARTAVRLARLREAPGRDPFAKRLEASLWVLLDGCPEAREAFGCPDDEPLGEYAANLELGQLVDAAEHLAQRADACKD